MKNKHGYTVTVEEVKSIDGVAVSLVGSWTMNIPEIEGLGVEPGDIIVTYTQGSWVRGIAYDGKFLRYETPEEAEAKSQEWLKERRLEKLERYVSNIDKWQEEVRELHWPLRMRIERFIVEGGVEFWIEDYPYESAAVKGANALLDKVEELYGIDVDFDIDPTKNKNALDWLNDWWELNTEKHGYDYKRQQELVPDFGEGHSGFTASAAYGLAKLVLEGESV